MLKSIEGRKGKFFDTAYETGFSSTSRLHDLFVKIEGMSPAEYKNGGKSLQINYSFSETPFGNVLQLPQKKESVLWLLKPIKKALGDLQAKFPNAF
jgi:AraC family transcriptional regulator of adaptative response/methylated-DNA-[protein]-cysteine methyltransferase